MLKRYREINGLNEVNFKYDKETDSLVIIFRHTDIEDTEEIRPGVIADFDEEGLLVSLEILNASKKVESPDRINYYSVENEPVLKVADH
ncbi:MAG: DUF2283 domain-containing protein [candidate division KSB1 bacterium]|nr:DUF2283 domain-containing protein [candidate division KSB1 bacterium]